MDGLYPGAAQVQGGFVTEVATSLIERLGLQPHPEGGWYRETFRSPFAVSTARGLRSASTAILFLLPEGTFSAWHRVVGADEAWHFYGGSGLHLHTLSEDGTLSTRTLSAHEPQAVVGAGLWQAAEPAAGGHALVGCTVAPGFDFADFELPERSALVARFPNHRAVLERLTR